MTKDKRCVGQPKIMTEAPQRLTDNTISTSMVHEQLGILTMEREKSSETRKSPTPVEIITSLEKKKGKVKPWVEIIQGNRNLNREIFVNFVAPQLINSEEKIVIDESDMVEELSYWENIVTLFALGESLSMHTMNNFMEKSWNLVSLPELYFNDVGYFIVWFKNQEDQRQVMEQGPYFIYGKLLFPKY